MKTDWDTIINGVGKTAVVNFARGVCSGRELVANAANTNASPLVRNLLRDKGVTYARRLMRKALARRGTRVALVK